MQFINRRTVEQFKSEKQTNKLLFSKAYVGSGADKRPLTYKDAEGKDTGIQKITVSDDAGNTISWCALAVARDVISGKLDASKGLAFVDCVTDDGEVYADRLVYNNAQEVVMSL